MIPRGYSGLFSVISILSQSSVKCDGYSIEEWPILSTRKNNRGLLGDIYSCIAMFNNQNLSRKSSSYETTSLNFKIKTMSLDVHLKHKGKTGFGSDENRKSCSLLTSNHSALRNCSKIVLQSPNAQFRLRNHKTTRKNIDHELWETDFAACLKRLTRTQKKFYTSMISTKQITNKGTARYLGDSMFDKIIRTRESKHKKLSVPENILKPEFSYDIYLQEYWKSAVKEEETSMRKGLNN